VKYNFSDSAQAESEELFSICLKFKSCSYAGYPVTLCESLMIKFLVSYRVKNIMSCQHWSDLQP